MKSRGWRASWRDGRLGSPPDRWTRCRTASQLAESRRASHDRSTGRLHLTKRSGGSRQLPVPPLKAKVRLVSKKCVAVAVLTLGAAVPAISVIAQTATPAPYRAPTIALVQPPTGSTVPRDKPVVVIRFARGEPADPVDVRTFAVTVDGSDRTELFQVTAEEAWGALSRTSGDSLITLGGHAVIARVCSVRGACGETSTTVLVVEPPTATASTQSQDKAKSTRARVIELVLDAVRKFITP